MCSMANLRSRFSVASALVLGVIVMCHSACGPATPPASTTHSTSVSDLLKAVPNLNSLDIVAVDYATTRSTVSGGVPSPSDTLLELQGTVDLSDSSALKLKSRFDWKATRRDDIPAGLLSILPSGDYQVSTKLNDSFAKNPTYAYGFIVVVANSWGRLYVLATDIDHPIK